MISADLLKYCEEKILPLYFLYDIGHNHNHIKNVVANSIEIASKYNVRLDMVYAAAIFHDIGIMKNRNNHHIISAEMLKKDEFMKNFFNNKDLLVIAEAIEDHRSSIAQSPRSVYGEILSSADRMIDPETIILRSFYYNKSKFDNYSRDQIISLVFNHLNEKYGNKGYLKIPICTQKHIDGLDTLREMLKDYDQFKCVCNEII